MAEAPKGYENKSTGSKLTNLLQDYADKVVQFINFFNKPPKETSEKYSEDDRINEVHSLIKNVGDVQKIMTNEFGIDLNQTVDCGLWSEKYAEDDAMSLMGSPSSSAGDDLKVNASIDNERLAELLAIVGEEISKAHWANFPEDGAVLPLGYHRPSILGLAFCQINSVLRRTVRYVMKPWVHLVWQSVKGSREQKKLSELGCLMTSMEQQMKQLTSMPVVQEHEGTTVEENITFSNAGIPPSCETLEPLLQEDKNNVLKYTLMFQSAGLFKCKLTGLMFKMETPGEVEYYSVPWANKLEELHCEPAGPLYNINCLHGTLVQLYLPHCEIISDGKHEHLRVAHVTDDGLEMLTAKKITDAYVVMDITGLSLFGLITLFTDYVLGRNIRALVLLFLQIGSKPELQVLLLSKNTDLEKVKQKRKNEFYIQRNPNCEINTSRYYSLFTDPPGLNVTPERAQYVEDSQNFFPAFTVTCSTLKEMKLMLKDEANTVWSSSVNVEEKDVLSERQHGSKPPMSEDFFQKHKGDLETRLPKLEPILIQLERTNVLNSLERDEIESHSTPTKRNGCLLGILDRRGARAQKIFCQVLQDVDPYLVEDLERDG